LGAADGDDGLLLAAATGDASVAGAEEGIGASGSDSVLAENTGEVVVAVSGGAVALGFAGVGV
jgi:hypothetical protein